MKGRRPSLTICLNNSTSLKIQIVQEKFIVESLRALFFHLSTSNYFRFDSGIFSLDSMVGTHDYTPKSLQNLLKPTLEAASQLFQIKAFIIRRSTSSLQSVLQEAMQHIVITPFYRDLEAVRGSTLLEFVFETRPIFAELKHALDVASSSDPAETVFHLARTGSKPMMKIAVQCLRLFAELCRNVITIHNSNALNAPDFFINRSSGSISIGNLVSIVPPDFAKDIAAAALALIVRAPPMKIEAPLENMSVDINEILLQQENYLSFELLCRLTFPSPKPPRRPSRTSAPPLGRCRFRGNQRNVRRFPRFHR
jgi:hypothetical protein